jgi:uncharacterized protein YdaU (DUF1376 family)
MRDLPKRSRPCKPLWMPLYVTQFLADTTHMTATQGWAYINLLCAMWRSDDGTLPNDNAVLARVSKVHPPLWEKAWNAIKHLFDVDGDRVTSAALQAELGKANAKIVMKRAAAAVGGKTTQFKRWGSPIFKTAPKPLKSNDGAQADAQANYNHNIENKKEERGASPLPCEGKASAPLKKEGLQGESVVIPFNQSQAHTPPEGPISEETRAANVAKLDEELRRLKEAG